MAVYSNEKMEKIAAARRLHQRQYAAYRKAIAQGASVWDAQRAADDVKAPQPRKQLRAENNALRAVLKAAERAERSRL